MSAPPFGGEPCTVDRPRFAIVPVPYEKTTTYRKGTAQGPAALLEASTQVELFDEEVRREPLAHGVLTLPPVATDAMPDGLADALEPVLDGQLARGRIPIVLGGEHSISLGPLRATARHHPGFGILQIDAHPDLRDEYEGTRYGHGCVMRRALDLEGVARLVPVGLRAVSPEDDEVLRAEERVRAYPMHALVREAASVWIARVVDELPERVYLSIDLDGLDPSIVPGTGTPEPGGLGWWDTLALLRAVCEQRTVVGCDVVELLPEPPSRVSDFAAARLVFKLLAYLTR